MDNRIISMVAIGTAVVMSGLAAYATFRKQKVENLEFSVHEEHAIDQSVEIIKQLRDEIRDLEKRQDQLSKEGRNSEILLIKDEINTLKRILISRFSN